jgi:copper oxidase (laccase) domain-containing protein
MALQPTITAADRGRRALCANDAVPDTDGLITATANVVLAVILADYVPVLSASRDCCRRQ